jgi:hypothetical protein
LLESALWNRWWREVLVRTLSEDSGINSTAKTAVFSFNENTNATLPNFMQAYGQLWNFQLKYLQAECNLYVDNHFLGFTVLHQPPLDQYEFE